MANLSKLERAIDELARAVKELVEEAEKGTPPRVWGGKALKVEVDAHEKVLVEEVLRIYTGNVTHAAVALELTREGLYKIMRRHGIKVDRAGST